MVATRELVVMSVLAQSEDMIGNGPVDPAIAKIASGYRILGLMRRGNDYDTYDAWSEQRFSRCVVKTPRTDRPARRSTTVRLVREGEILTALNHPHLVRGYELRRGRRPVVVLETVTGATLGYLLGSSGRLGTRDLAELGTQLCSALRYLHAYGYLHLDVKPGNVIVEAGRAKLIDLSLSQPPGPCPQGLGTAAYLAPEQARGEEVGEAADVWGLGVTLYEGATGASPFERHRRPSDAVPAGSDAASSCASERCSACGQRTDYRQLGSRAPRLRSLRRVPAGLGNAIDAALEPSAADRPSLAELGGVLSAFA